MDAKLNIAMVFTIGFVLTSLLGAIAQKIKLPPILGYLIAGYLVGPYSPGIVADLKIAEQLAEIGVILMLYGVGLHFKLEDLISVKNIAIPGALFQTLTTTLLGAGIVLLYGWDLPAGIILGLAIGVASTVVLVRMLSDNHLLHTLQGHIAVGWLIVEDIFTVAMLILLPVFAAVVEGAQLPIPSILWSVGVSLFNFILLAVLMFTLGQRIVTFILTHVARFRSHELMTITVLALTFLIAVGSSLIFGTSIALGAFIAGMVIGQTDIRHQAAANSLPLQDVFAVFFFLAVGMLFNPYEIIKGWPLFLGLLAIVLIAKPLAAFLIVIVLKYPLKAALTVAIALAQIGEFSFILAEQAMHFHLLPDEGYDLLVGCAFISISLNPLLFRSLDWLEAKALPKPTLQTLRAKLLKESPGKIARLFETQVTGLPKVMLIGFGPIGKMVTQVLEKLHIAPIIIDQNIDTVPKLMEANRQVIFGDAAQPNILEAAKIALARLLVITVPEVATTQAIIKSARQHNPNIRILARIRYLEEKHLMEELQVEWICCEEEAARAFARRVAKLVNSVKVEA